MDNRSYNLRKVNVIGSMCNLCLFGIIFMYSVISEPPFLIEMGMLTITIAILILNNINSKIKVGAYFWWSILFFMTSTVSWLFSEYFIENKMIIIRIGYLVTLLIMLVTYLNKIEKIEFILKSYLLSGIIIILRLITSTPLNLLFTSRMGVTIDLNSNSIGITMAICIFICIYFIQNIDKTKIKFKYILLISIYLIFLIGSGSRKALIDLIIGSCIMYSFKPKKEKTQSRRKIVKLVFIVILGCILGYYMCMKIPYLYDTIGRRFEGLIYNTGNRDESAQIRYSMMSEGFRLFKEKPILGHGVNSFSYMTIFNVYSHSNYIELLVSNGVIGTIIYYSIYLWIIVKQYFLLIKKQNVNSLFLVLAVISIINDIAMVSYYSIYTLILPIIAGISFIYCNDYKDKNIQLNR